MAQAVSRRPLTAESRVRSRVGTCGICGGQSGTGTGFLPEYFGFSLSISFHRCSINLKIIKNLVILIIFITGFHNKPQGCGVSVASAAGPFNLKNASHSPYYLRVSHHFIGTAKAYVRKFFTFIRVFTIAFPSL
jgi:hypothetical protein